MKIKQSGMVLIQVLLFAAILLCGVLLTVQTDKNKQISHTTRQTANQLTVLSNVLINQIVDQEGCPLAADSTSTGMTNCITVSTPLQNTLTAQGFPAEDMTVSITY